MEDIKAIVVNGPNGQQEYGIEDAEARENVQEIVEGAPEELNTFKEAFDAFKEGSDVLEQITEAQQANAKAIEDEATRAQGTEQVLDEKITEEWRRATEAEQGIEAKALDAIAEESKVTDEKIAKEKTALVNGDTIVGQAREIHSRNGKTVTDSFLARTTAGSGTIGDGVASLRSVGGNIVKNLVDGSFESGWYLKGTSLISDKVAYLERKASNLLQVDYVGSNVIGHRYYACAYVKSNGCVSISFNNLYVNINRVTPGEKWVMLSVLGEHTNDTYNRLIIREEQADNFAVYKPHLIDLTEEFSEAKASQMTKEECDKLFGTMDVLPQGLTIANPKEFKSTGYNQADPNKVLVGKGIENGAIVDKVGSNLAVVPCLPCKIGEGENNGYCIHGAFDEGAEKVYLTPLNPLEVEGELYMHELTKDATTDTYVPLIKGYMLVEVPTTANLCAHFLWSEDKCKRDTYEPYFESKIELPTIPQMNEWGLAGIQSSGTLACDEIDLERGVYVKRIGTVDMGSLIWTKHNNPTRFNSNALKDVVKIPTYNSVANALTNGLTIMSAITSSNRPLDSKQFMVYSDGMLFVNGVDYSTVEELKTALQGVMLYYELAEPEEYPLPKVDNNYIGGDYGVEQFDSKIPCNANNLYYMRSLAGETRNFLDRLMAGLGTADATVVADRILAVVNPAVEPTNIEEI